MLNLAEAVYTAQLLRSKLCFDLWICFANAVDFCFIKISELNVCGASVGSRANLSSLIRSRYPLQQGEHKLMWQQELGISCSALLLYVSLLCSSGVFEGDSHRNNIHQNLGKY